MIEPNPKDWGWWVKYLLEQMEIEAERRIKHPEYEIMLKSLFEDISARINEGKW